MTVEAGTAHAGLIVDIGAEALVFQGAGRPFERIGVPTVVLHPGELLVEVELATICGSDVHTYAGRQVASGPVVLGHEQVGRVVALGPHRPARDVGGHPLSVGDRVVWGVGVDCGRCRYCHAGIPQACATVRRYGHDRVRRGWELSGGFASHVQLLARTPIVRVSDELPAELLAPVSCATATIAAALEAASAIRPLAGATVVVTGAGMRGLTAIAMARDAGATVIATDPDAERRELAERFGARATADDSSAGLAAALRRVPSARSGPTIGIEVSGAAAALRALLDVTDVGGVILLVGSVFNASTVPLDPEALARRQLTIRGVHDYAPRHLVQAVEFLQRTAGTAPFADLVGEQFPLAEAERAFRHAADREVARVGLRP
ncbi:alcohol dehydrogenase catalytic domain-containing protein [soil metagenome]